MVDPIPYSLEEFLPESSKRASAMAAVDKVNNFARDWAENHRDQTFEPEQIGGGCALLKKETILKMGQFPSRTPLGTFDLINLSHASPPARLPPGRSEGNVCSQLRARGVVQSAIRP